MHVAIIWFVHWFGVFLTMLANDRRRPPLHLPARQVDRTPPFVWCTQCPSIGKDLTGSSLHHGLQNYR